MLNDIGVGTSIILFLLISTVTLSIVGMIFSATSDIIIGANVISAISILCLWWYMTRYLVIPINTVKRSTEEVASGNLAISIPEFGNNCAGRLIPGINSLSNNISALVNEIRTSSQAAMAPSEQLAERSAELSMETEQQLGALMQTATNMDEITVNARNNADNTQIASVQTTVATQCVIQGGELTVQIATNMRLITERAQQMTEVIMLIDGTVFQTDILTLNTAMETTRAGEHGKSFSVVTDEIRMFAYRSADAAKNAKQLIVQTHQSVQ